MKNSHFDERLLGMHPDLRDILVHRRDERDWDLPLIAEL